LIPALNECQGEFGMSKQISFLRKLAITLLVC